jgi:MarR family transcriptional regulator for hemolysin
MILDDMAQLNSENHIGHNIIQASKTIQPAFDLELRNNVGITMAQWRAINALATQTGITQREISDKLGLDSSSLIPLVDRLESKKLVIRMPDHNDRRINRLYLTKRAEALLGQMHSCAHLFKRHLTEGINKDQLKITRLVLERINQNLETHYALNSEIRKMVVESQIANLNSKTRAT